MTKLTLVELSDLPRKPHGCPPEVERSWARLVATHKSVGGLFTTLNELRAGQDDMRGAVSETHRDQARAAIVFTAAGIDACLRTLLRDSCTPCSPRPATRMAPSPPTSWPTASSAT